MHVSVNPPLHTERCDVTTCQAQQVPNDVLRGLAVAVAPLPIRRPRCRDLSYNAITAIPSGLFDFSTGLVKLYGRSLNCDPWYPLHAWIVRHVFAVGC